MSRNKYARDTGYAQMVRPKSVTQPGYAIRWRGRWYRTEDGDYDAVMKMQAAFEPLDFGWRRCLDHLERERKHFRDLPLFDFTWLDAPKSQNERCLFAGKHDHGVCLAAYQRRDREADGSDFQQYRRTQIAEMRPWKPGDDMTGVSVSAEDAKAGSPKEGDMIARNPKNHADQWLVAAAYFAEHFEPI